MLHEVANDFLYLVVSQSSVSITCGLFQSMQRTYFTFHPLHANQQTNQRANIL